MISPTESLIRVDWVTTRFGRLHHIADTERRSHTLCGRIAHDFTDAPWSWFNRQACSICLLRHDAEARA